LELETSLLSPPFVEDGAQSLAVHFVNADSTVGRHIGKKRAGSESLPSQPNGLYVLRQLSTNSGNDDGGGGNSGARCTSNMMAQNSSHSTDMVGSIHTDNSRIRNPDSQFRPKSERQNVAPEQKPIHLPPMQLREVFSYSFPFLLVVSRGNGKLLLRISSTLLGCASPSMM
jgi:hypothetical protein